MSEKTVPHALSQAEFDEDKDPAPNEVQVEFEEIRANSAGEDLIFTEEDKLRKAQRRAKPFIRPNTN